MVVDDRDVKSISGYPTKNDYQKQAFRPRVLSNTNRYVAYLCLCFVQLLCEALTNDEIFHILIWKKSADTKIYSLGYHETPLGCSREPFKPYK